MNVLAKLHGAAPRPIPARAGVGLRFRHHRAVLDEKPAIPWFEVHTENYMGGGIAPSYLDAIRQDYPLSLHGVGLSLGSADGLDASHLARVRDAVWRFEPALVSEHVSWSAAGETYLADLLPLPMTEEALGVVCRHVDQVQSTLGRPILVENPSTYLCFVHSIIPEWEFLSEIVRRTGCGLLCDVNNIYVSACNHGWDPHAYLEALPREAVAEVHLAGHSVRHVEDGQTLRIDDHGSRVAAEVWALYREALCYFGAVPTLIEWDTDVPSLQTLMEEAAIADSILEVACHEHACAHAG
ncbi:TPA: DUF692 domain-containing protein [Burkholderia aenigmatica]|uniref:MNIO family bufferin maturase n=1 Tax=Burkholderia sp. AU45251 TaxID=3059204 RepID=UPI002653EB55|nr:DUF692 domain-containing protein [Burkholderia sp. AU45251]HDR9482343.1 DUF692 domain-containing protein [Burkholderia aenigmatica]MDN7515017.1 DUF692 domain-containing protein [Burkholderia sp. AU45251]HDR9514649.1 DUF692 domain-containing protein [Burkholderia aenigmatica]HDR9590714.1 DUF692 domain-containing protein [Burkholderia aenigmatica]HDR9599870.1 DUF692 domain-containing protein [Burkholderia aenigmatica]